MKKSFIDNAYFFVALCMVILVSCKRDTANRIDTDPYQLTIDSGLIALLNPVNQEIVSNMVVMTAQPGSQLFSLEVPGKITYDTRNEVHIASRVGGRIERLMIKYNYQPVKKGALIMELYSPDLVSAQRELILISKNGAEADLLQRAKQRLLLLGMQLKQVEQVLVSGKPLYRVPVYSPVSGYILENRGASDQSSLLVREGQYVQSGESLFKIYQLGNLIAEFSLEPQIANSLKGGSEILVQAVEGSEGVLKERVGIIEPTLKDGENFSVARVYLKNRNFYPGQLVKAHIPISIKGGWWLAAEAVWQAGDHSIVFKKENKAFRPYEVKTGAKFNGMVQVLENISDWEIAANSFYLVDNESFIRVNKLFQ